MRCVVALPGLLNRRSPRVRSVIDLFDLPRWTRHGDGKAYIVIALRASPALC